MFKKDSQIDIERKIAIRRLMAREASHREELSGGGTCFAGFEPICSDSLTPNPRKADRLRIQKYW